MIYLHQEPWDRFSGNRHGISGGIIYVSFLLSGGVGYHLYNWFGIWEYKLLQLVKTNINEVAIYYKYILYVIGEKYAYLR